MIELLRLVPQQEHEELNQLLRTWEPRATSMKVEVSAPPAPARIKVEVDRKGVKVRTITGYYPVGSL